MPSLDQYIVKARLGPALLAMLPATVALLTLNPGGVLGWTLIAAAIMQAGGGFLLAQYVGDRGKASEPALHREWGGRPTELMLSHTHAPNRTTREIRHRKLEQLIPVLRMPSEEEESADFAAACQTYEAALDQVRPKVRHLPLVFAENVHYGFRRNAWALRRHGIAVAAAAVLMLGAEIIGRLWVRAHIELHSVLALLAAAVLLWFWTCVIKPAWVRRAADLYASRFLEGLDGL